VRAKRASKEIVKGDGRQAAADRLNITVGTARSHLSSIFDTSGRAGAIAVSEVKRGEADGRLSH